jgi:hypothetical protein
MHEYTDWIVRGIITLFFGMFAWAFRKMRTDIDKHTDELNKIKLYTMENYLQKKDFDKFEKRLFDKLEKIEVNKENE